MKRKWIYLYVLILHCGFAWENAGEGIEKG